MSVEARRHLGQDRKNVSTTEDTKDAEDFSMLSAAEELPNSQPHLHCVDPWVRDRQTCV